ncbi:MAG: glycine cleavage system aminomethyltransferase GcvT [Candidatus Nanopelagicaceae bacterium]
MPRYSPLHEKHRALGAKLADFGGWDMPIEYPATSGGGVVNEHVAVRESVGLFDVSHLGKAEVSGEDALESLNAAFTNDLTKIGDGQAQYTMLCDPNSGGVVDDLIVYRKSRNDFLLVPNAANTAEVVRRLQSGNDSKKFSIRDCHEKYGVLALQGPKSSAVLNNLGVTSNLSYMSFQVSNIAGSEVIICRTGYTGEHGFEILPLWSDTSKIWEALSNEIQKFGGRVCGLGARDTLRTEMGYPLHGHELSLEITPVQANAGWAVGWKKNTFWGREILLNEREMGPKRIQRGLRLLEKGIPRLGMSVTASGKPIGVVTSGTFSPTIKCGIALALLASDIELGARVSIDVRGKLLDAEVVKPPFVESRVK